MSTVRSKGTDMQTTFRTGEATDSGGLTHA